MYDWSYPDDVQPLQPKAREPMSDDNGSRRSYAQNASERTPPNGKANPYVVPANSPAGRLRELAAAQRGRKRAAEENEASPEVEFSEPPKVTPRQEALREAERIVCRDREATHGNPEDNFENIAWFWNAFLRARHGAKFALDALDVSQMMDLMKSARFCGNREHMDTLLDKLGYNACAYEIAKSRVLKGEPNG